MCVEVYTYYVKCMCVYMFEILTQGKISPEIKEPIALISNGLNSFVNCFYKMKIIDQNLPFKLGNLRISRTSDWIFRTENSQYFQIV